MFDKEYEDDLSDIDDEEFYKSDGLDALDFIVIDEDPILEEDCNDLYDDLDNWNSSLMWDDLEGEDEDE